MTSLAIEAVGLCKDFHIGVKQERYRMLRDSLSNMALKPVRAVSSLVKRDGHRQGEKRVRILRDISFEVKAGETVGLIGRNGAGKSTLLKILSRITEPTDGFAELHGRVGSLLEVGTGFHPELTGRENISMSGAILGMSRTEIERKFDEIVAFAEVEEFIDTPVKHYSSGMYLRLAFSVAAHLEPEILLVDEVLAVGDASFQRKCMGKMGDVAREGRTVIFVSHNMAAVQSLCQRGIFLNNGTLEYDGTAREAVGYYLNTLEQNNLQDLSQRTDRHGKGKIRFKKIDVIRDLDDALSNTLATGEPAFFVFHLSEVKPGMVFKFNIHDSMGQSLTKFQSTIHAPNDISDLSIGSKMICEIDELLLAPGRYRIDVSLISDGELQDYIEAAASFDVEQGVLRGRPVVSGGKYSRICHPHRWILPAQ